LNNIIKRGNEIKAMDLVKVAEFLNVRIEDLLPVPKTMDVEKMSLTDLVKAICRKEIELYIKKNCPVK